MQIVGRYLRRLGSDRLSDELVSAAYEGIITAVNKVATGNGMTDHDNLTGYIVEYIHRYISDALNRRKAVYVPRETIRDSKKPIARPHRVALDDKLFQDRPSVRQRELTDFEIAEILAKITNSDQERTILALRRDGLTDAEIAEATGLSKTSVFVIRKDIEKRFLELMYE